MSQTYSSSSSTYTCTTMNNNFLIISRLKYPVNQLCKHFIEWLTRFSGWDSMIRPSQVTYLSNYFCPLRWGQFKLSFNKRFCQGFFTYCLNKSLFIKYPSKAFVFNWISLWPILMALYSSLLIQVADFNNQSNIFLVNHSPKAFYCIR